MKYLCALACALSAGVLVGCGSGGKESPVKYTPEEQYSLLIKRRVADLTEGLERNLKDAQSMAEAMTADLGEYEKKSGPEHKAIYAELQKTQQELLAAFKKSASLAEIQGKVRKIEALASKLPDP